MDRFNEFLQSQYANVNLIGIAVMLGVSVWLMVRALTGDGFIQQGSRILVIPAWMIGFPFAWQAIWWFGVWALTR